MIKYSLVFLPSTYAEGAGSTEMLTSVLNHLVERDHQE